MANKRRKKFWLLDRRERPRMQGPVGRDRPFFAAYLSERGVMTVRLRRTIGEWIKIRHAQIRTLARQ